MSGWITAEEINTVYSVLNVECKRGIRTKINNRVIFALLLCGLRREEVTLVKMEDVFPEGDRPIIRLKKEYVKGKASKGRKRDVPIYWDVRSTTYIINYYKMRIEEEDAQPNDPFVLNRLGKAYSLSGINRQYSSCISCLPDSRQAVLSPHSNRHSFCSHALAVGHSPASVRDAAGHSSIAITDIYAHSVENRDLPSLYGENG